VTSPSHRHLHPHRATRHVNTRDIHTLSGIRRRDPNNQAAAELRLRLRGHRDRNSTHIIQYYLLHLYNVLVLRLAFLFHLHSTFRIRVSSGSIVSDYGRSGFDPWRGQRIFPLTSVSRPALRSTQPPVQWIPGVLSPGVKARPGRDADHSPHLGPRLRMSRSYISSPPKRLHGV
jgi:hypothetical protein